jgi:predicted ATPase
VLTRIQIDNFRCFEEFDFAPKELNVILGPNGSGKSTLFDILHAVLRITAGWSNVDEVFSIENRSRFSTNANRPQRVAINTSVGQNDYMYSLVVAHTKKGKARIEHEEVLSNSELIYRFDGRTVHLTGGDERTYLFEGQHSPLSSIPHDDKSPLSRALVELQKLWMIRPVPQLMRSVTSGEASWLMPDLSNFSDWFRELAQNEPQILVRIGKSLRPILDGFDGFAFEASGSSHRTRALLVRFKRKNRSLGPAGMTLEELSDGQRLLLALYTLLHHVVDSGYTLCIDEPENYLALPEIQPWLDELRDRALKRRSQVFIISHHPRVVNMLAASYGFWFDRKGTGSVTAHQITRDIIAKNGGLSIATLMERGWIHE